MAAPRPLPAAESAPPRWAAQCPALRGPRAGSSLPPQGGPPVSPTGSVRGRCPGPSSGRSAPSPWQEEGRVLPTRPGWAGGACAAADPPEFGKQAGEASLRAPPPPAPRWARGLLHRLRGERRLWPREAAGAGDGGRAWRGAQAEASGRGAAGEAGQKPREGPGRRAPAGIRAGGSVLRPGPRSLPRAPRWNSRASNESFVGPRPRRGDKHRGQAGHWGVGVSSHRDMGQGPSSPSRGDSGVASASGHSTPRGTGSALGPLGAEGRPSPWAWPNSRPPWPSGACCPSAPTAPATEERQAERGLRGLPRLRPLGRAARPARPAWAAFAQLLGLHSWAQGSGAGPS